MDNKATRTRKLYVHVHCNAHACIAYGDVKAPPPAPASQPRTLGGGSGPSTVALFFEKLPLPISAPDTTASVPFPAPPAAPPPMPQRHAQALQQRKQAWEHVCEL